MRRPAWARAPAIALVLIASFIPLYSVIAHDWPVVFVVMLFWFDALLLIAFNAIRILVAPLASYRSANAVRIIGYAGINLVFHGGLALVYGYLLGLIFGGEVTSHGIASNPDVPFEVLRSMLEEPGTGWSALAILGTHLYALAAYFAGRGPWTPTELARLVDLPMRRLAALHVGIVFGGAVLILLAPPVLAAAMLLAGKTVSDLRALSQDSAATGTAASPAGFRARARR